MLAGTEVRFGTKRESFYIFSVCNLSSLRIYALLKVTKKVNKLISIISPYPAFSVQFSHVQLLDPMDCSTPGLPVYHQLLEFT